MKEKKVLHDPIAYKERVSSIQFGHPRKEQVTTGRYMPAGSYYGKGHVNPVGHQKAAKGLSDGPIPQKAVCFPCDQAIRK